jgi:hypothetical protein
MNRGTFLEAYGLKVTRDRSNDSIIQGRRDLGLPVSSWSSQTTFSVGPLSWPRNSIISARVKAMKWGFRSRPSKIVRGCWEGDHVDRDADDILQMIPDAFSRRGQPGGDW